MDFLQSTLLAAMLAGCIAAPAGAQDCGGACTTGFEVYLDVAASCRFTGSSDVGFGTHTVVPGRQLDAYGSLTVQCNVPVSYSVGLDGGLHGSGVTDRRMAADGGDTIAYQLYSGDAGTTPCTAASGSQWGDASGGCIYRDSYAGTPQEIEVHGRLTIDNPRAGNYSDTVTATITY